MKLKILGVVIVILLVVLSVSVYIVDEREQVIITRFGKAIGEAVTEPGLNFKLPFPVDQANYFPKQLLEWDGDPGQIPTLDKTFIWVDTFARWKIVDPLKFFETVTNEVGALARLDDILDAAVRNYITSFPLIETVRKSNRKLEFEIGTEDTRSVGPLGEVTMGRGKIVRGILNASQPKLEKFGIEMVDVKIKRLNYVEEVQKSVYGRMIAERNQIAEKYRSEGKGEARKIEGDMEKDLKQITSEAYQRAQEIKGKADAEATKIYADALGKDPEFYSFLQTLDIYKETMDKGSTLVLSTDSEFLKYFKGYQGGSQLPQGKGPAAGFLTP